MTSPVSATHAQIELNDTVIGDIVVSHDPDVEGIQIATSAFLALTNDAVIYVNGEPFTYDDIKDYLA